MFCGETSAVRPKLLLIDEAWMPGPGKDPRHAYFADLRVDDVQARNLRARPLEQFIDGSYCDRCSGGFAAEQGLREGRRRYRQEGRNLAWQPEIGLKALSGELISLDSELPEFLS